MQLEELGKFEKFNDLIRTRICDLLASYNKYLEMHMCAVRLFYGSQ
jgi:hypothetical protein